MENMYYTLIAVFLVGIMTSIIIYFRKDTELKFVQQEIKLIKVEQYMHRTNLGSLKVLVESMNTTSVKSKLDIDKLLKNQKKLVKNQFILANQRPKKYEVKLK